MLVHFLLFLVSFEVVNCDLADDFKHLATNFILDFYFAQAVGGESIHLDHVCDSQSFFSV